MYTLRLLLALFVLIGLFGVASAQETEPPLLVLQNDGIYAVAPDSGELQALVPLPNGAAALRAHTHQPVTLFSADWLSPDGRTLVYRTLAPDALARVQQNTYRNDHALYAVDLLAGGNPVELALPGHDDADVTVESVAWTADGARVAAALVNHSRENEDARTWTLAVYERDTWELVLTAPLPMPAYATARRLIAAGDSLVLVDTGIQGPRVIFTRLDADGQALEPVEIDASVSSVVNLYILVPFNPLFDGERWLYGLNQQMSGELFAGIDLASGELAPFEPSLFPGLVSALAPETSLRLSAGIYSGDQIGLLVRNADGEMVGDIPFIKAYAFGITGDNAGNTFALSPDGQTVAFLENGALKLWRDGEVTDLNIEAEALAWAPPRYLPVYDPTFLLG